MYLLFNIYKNIPVSFDFITTWNQGVFLCLLCICIYTEHVAYAQGDSDFHRQQSIPLQFNRLPNFF
jgi:hypothetical protein